MQNEEDYKYKNYEKDKFSNCIQVRKQKNIERVLT